MGNLLYRGSTSLIKTPDSDGIVLAERTSIRDIYRGPKAACVSGLLARGTFGTVARDGFVVTSSSFEGERAGIGRLTINWEAGGPDATLPLPCDDFNLKAVELYPRIERNSFFDGITNATLALAYQAAQGSTPLARSNSLTLINGLSDSTQKSLGLALVAKLNRGEQTFYLAGCRYTWIAHSYTLPDFTLGGFIQAPLGPLTGYFTGIDFLRLSDELEPCGVNGSCFKLYSNWLGGPAGYWDTDLYP